MADKNIQIRHKKDGTWESLFPYTLSENIFNEKGDQEIMDARDGEPSLKDRLDKEKQEVTTELEQKADQEQLDNIATDLNQSVDEIMNITDHQPKPSMYVRRIGQTKVESFFRIAFKYTDDRDMWVDMERVGVNNLMQIARIWTIENDSQHVSSDLENQNANIFLTANTDFVSPYIVRANANDNGDDATYDKFTGGWHGTSDNKPSANSYFYNGYIRGVPIELNKTYPCEEFTLNVTNGVQAYNTRLKSGGGREVLQENISYIFRERNIEVVTNIMALESITIERYYGVQTQNSAWWDSITYRYSDNIGTIRDFIGTDSGSKSVAPEVDSFVVRNSSYTNSLVCWVDNESELGRRTYVADDKPLAFTSGTKSYHNIVNGVDLALGIGEGRSLRGGFILQGKSMTEGFSNAYYLRNSSGRFVLFDMFGAVTGTIRAENDAIGNRLTIEKTSHPDAPNNGVMGHSGWRITNQTFGAQSVTYKLE